jgi:hypothetical protein
VPVTSLCPCSKKISERGAHNQRSHVTVAARIKTFVWIEEIIDLRRARGLERALWPAQAPDEKFVTEQAYDNPKFVEDMVRDIAAGLNADHASRRTWSSRRTSNRSTTTSAYAMIRGLALVRRREVRISEGEGREAGGELRYARTEGPGHFATFLSEQRRAPGKPGAPGTRNEPVPPSCEEFSGLGFMGGPMSANDRMPLDPGRVAAHALCRGGKVPVIGHCLGGQMLARATGGQVTRANVKEIGWVPVRAERNAAASSWFGADGYAFDTFEWHEDTFSYSARCHAHPHGRDLREPGLTCWTTSISACNATWR